MTSLCLLYLKPTINEIYNTRHGLPLPSRQSQFFYGTDPTHCRVHETSLQWLLLCQENNPQTFTPPPIAWNVDKKHVGSMDSCYWRQIWPYHLQASAEIQIHQTGLRFSRLQLSSVGEPEPNAASDFCSWLKVLEPNRVFCCCRPSALKFDVFFLLRCFFFFSPYL